MKPLVSINCITYNHEKYIADAIDSFLMQKTDFDFEIVIGEDCSTDNTRSIVQEYADKYPEKIVLITSDQNVGMQKNERRVFEASRGKYIAECEGDDYWTDPYKLQKQVDYMENNPDCTLCFHNADKVNEDKTKIETMIDENIDNRTYDAGEIAALGVIATNSKFYPKYVLEDMPSWYFECTFTDLPAELISTSRGYAYYMKDNMSVYRVGIKDSAMEKAVRDKLNIRTVEERIKLPKETIEVLNAFNNYTNFKFERGIRPRREKFEFDVLYAQGKIKELKKDLLSDD